MPLGGTTQALSIAPDCARAIGFSRVILDAATQRADVAAALAGSTAASPSAPDWSGIKGQLLPLPPRGQLISGPTPTTGGPPYNINDCCSSTAKGGFPSKVSTISAAVAAAQPELAKASVAKSWAGIKWKPAAEKSLLVFCCFFDLGIDGYFFGQGNAGSSTALSVDAHHYFVAEIAGELFK
jgi:hypothetical protein